MLKKEIVFLFTHLLLKFTVSFPCEDQWQTTVFAVPLFVTKRNHRYFHITLQLLQYLKISFTLISTSKFP